MRTPFEFEDTVVVYGRRVSIVVSIGQRRARGVRGAQIWLRKCCVWCACTKPHVDCMEIVVTHKYKRSVTGVRVRGESEREHKDATLHSGRSLPVSSCDAWSVTSHTHTSQTDR